MVVSGYGGLDELTTTGPNRVSHYKDGHIHSYEINPQEYGFRGANITELLGDDAPTNAAILRGILSGEIQDAKRDVVLLNSAAALVAADHVNTIGDGIKRAGEIIDSGAALAKLDELVAMSQKIAA